MIKWEHQVGCIFKQNDGSSSGSWFYFLFTIIIVYFLIGSVVNIAVYKGFYKIIENLVKNFPEFLPNHEIWISVASWVSNAFDFITVKLRGNPTYVALS